MNSIDQELKCLYIERLISLRHIVRASGFTWSSSMSILPVRSYATKFMITQVVTLMEMDMFSDAWSGYSVQHLLLYYSNSYQNMPLLNGEVHFKVLCWSFWCQPILELPSTPPSCRHTHLCLNSLLCLSMLRLSSPACDPSGMIKHQQKNDIGRFVMGRIR